MGIVVLKFGGTSLKDKEMLDKVGCIIQKTVEEGQQVVAVVSAGGDHTDRLYQQGRSYCPVGGEEGLDLLLSTGEVVSTALLTLTLTNLGIKAVPLTGMKTGIYTDGQYGNGEIVKVDPTAIKQVLEVGGVAVVSGFQGIGAGGQIVTLGRGGSDISGVALGVALKAEQCVIYTDVEGVFAQDPHVVEEPPHFPTISYKAMLQLAELGAKVVHPKAVKLAMVGKLPLVVADTRNPYGRHTKIN